MLTEVGSQPYDNLFASLPYLNTQPIESSLINDDSKLPSFPSIPFENLLSTQNGSVWSERLETLESVIKQMHDPILQPSRNLAEVQDLERKLEGVLLTLRHIQDDVANIVNWAKAMNKAYRELKRVLCEMVNIVYSRVRLEQVFESSQIQASHLSL